MPKKTKIEPKAAAQPGSVDLKEVERLLKFMQEHGLEEFEYKAKGVKVRLKKPSSAQHVAFRPQPMADIMVTQPTASHSGTPAAKEAPSEAGRSEDLHVVKSPIVGTFYSAATPGSEPFVTVGSKVDAGQTLCIIEAMKLMNEIESDVAGEVARVFVENGQPVEYGEPLFGIRTHRKK